VPRDCEEGGEVGVLDFLPVVFLFLLGLGLSAGLMDGTTTDKRGFRRVSLSLLVVGRLEGVAEDEDQYEIDSDR